jgi:hypothetical protein
MRLEKVEEIIKLIQSLHCDTVFTLYNGQSCRESVHRYLNFSTISQYGKKFIRTWFVKFVEFPVTELYNIVWRHNIHYNLICDVYYENNSSHRANLECFSTNNRVPAIADTIWPQTYSARMVEIPKTFWCSGKFWLCQSEMEVKLE